LSCNSAEKFVGGSERRAVEAFGAGEVEIGFVNRNHFDDRGEFRKDGGYVVARFGIFFVVAIVENGVRAEASSGAEGHGGMDAEFAGF
jgi:hypothetical protein